MVEHPAAFPITTSYEPASATNGLVNNKLVVPWPETTPPFVTATPAFLHEKEVPSVATVIVCVPEPEQVAVGAVGCVLMVGVGLTSTVLVMGEPPQFVVEGPVGIIVNVTVIGEFVVFVNVAPVIFPEPLAAIPVTPTVLSLVHANVVPVTLLLVPRTIVVKAFPEQIV